MGDLEAKVDALLKMAKALDPPVKRIGVQENDSVYLLPTEEICFITTGDGGGVEYYAADGKKYVNFDSISGLDKKLAEDPKFMKVHKSYIVNLKQIATVTTVSGGRELGFRAWPDEKVKCAQDYVKPLEDYFKI